MPPASRSRADSTRWKGEKIRSRSACGTTALAVAILLLATILLASAFLVQRRQAFIHRLAAQQAARDELEHMVDERTADLNQTNVKLKAEVAERKLAEDLSFAQSKVLEMIASGAPQDKTLRAICRVVERIGDDFKAAIMRLDGNGESLSVALAPSSETLAPSAEGTHRACVGMPQPGPRVASSASGSTRNSRRLAESCPIPRRRLPGRGESVPERRCTRHRETGT